RASLYVVAKSPIARLVAWTRERGWADLECVSTAGNSYDADYFGDSSKVPTAIRRERGGTGDENWDETMFNVFRLDNGTVRHFWGSRSSKSDNAESAPQELPRSWRISLRLPAITSTL